MKPFRASPNACSDSRWKVGGEDESWTSSQANHDNGYRRITDMRQGHLPVAVDYSQTRPTEKPKYSTNEQEIITADWCVEITLKAEQTVKYGVNEQRYKLN